jgi:hypothetical protein
MYHLKSVAEDPPIDHLARKFDEGWSDRSAGFPNADVMRGLKCHKVYCVVVA